MSLRRLAQQTVVAACLFLSGTEAVACVNKTMDVTSTADAQNLVEALTCTGGGEFVVTWYGTVAIRQTFDVADGISLNVTGKDSSILSLNDAQRRATIVGDDITSKTGIFFVYGDSTLTLSNLVLRGGRSKTVVGGGAIEAQGPADANQTVNVIDCLLTDNIGNYTGGIFANHSVVNIYGTTDFIGNTGVLGAGSLLGTHARIYLYGVSTFRDNTGDLGGSILLGESDITFAGNTTFSNNTSPVGGAASVFDSTITFSGSTSFTNNTSASFGGALRVSDSTITFGGSTTFTNNTSVSSGGAIYCDACDITFGGTTTFTNNTSSGIGGACFLIYSDIASDGSTAFINNTSAEGGGAVHLDSTIAALSGNTTFTNNTCLVHGGAISAVGAFLTIEDSVFTGNSALDHGGAIYGEYSDLNISGATTFTKNVASRSGGGVYSSGSDTITLTGNVSFDGNFAFSNGGAMSINLFGGFEVDGATFVFNKAASGGAISVGATALVDSIVTFGVNLGRCTFEANIATQGGALYLFSAEGVVVNASVFRENTAVSSGGAIYHTGGLVLTHTRFVANQAALQGLAVASLGELSFARNTHFERNARYCQLGLYGYDEHIQMDNVDTCRAEVVCARCSVGCDDMRDGLSFSPNSTVPAVGCNVLPGGTVASSAGMTLATLDLAKGYYRTSNESHIVLECYQKDACIGGLDAGNYCATGYEGPYCALCEENYAPGIAYNCHKCSGTSLRYAVGLLLATLMVALGVGVVILSDLLAVVKVDGIAEEEEAPRGFWERRFSSCYDLLVKMFPLTSIKIVVVVWQILTQFAAIAGAVYPDEYQAFLSNLSPINLDIGFLLSFSCVMDTNFYDRLLITTSMPLVAFAVLGGTYAIAKKRNRRYELAIRAVQHKHISAAMFVAFFVYSSVSFTVFQTFVCDSLDDGVDYLRADYSLSCWSDQHDMYLAYSSVMVFVYPIGIPAAFTWWLGRNRHELADPGRETVARLRPFSGLWAAYRPSRFYYEVVEYGRRISLTAIAVFVLPGSAAQIAVVLLLAVVFSFISETMQPFANKVEMWLYRWGNGVVMASMYVALLRKVDVSGDDTPTQSAFAGVLIAGNMFMVVAVLVQSALFVKEWYGGKRPRATVDPRVRSAHVSSIHAIHVVGDADET